MSKPYEKPINWNTTPKRFLKYDEIPISKDSATAVFETLKKLFASGDLDRAELQMEEYEDLVKAFTELGKNLGRYEEDDVQGQTGGAGLKKKKKAGFTVLDEMYHV